MSRSGYSEDYDGNELYLYRQAVENAMAGKRGQAFFKALVEALDALSRKELIAGTLETSTGAVCALGALGKARGVDLAQLDPDDPYGVGKTFNIAQSLAREVVWENDDNSPTYGYKLTTCARCHGWGEEASVGRHPRRCIACFGRPVFKEPKYETPAQRFERIRRWAVNNILPPKKETKDAVETV